MTILVEFVVNETLRFDLDGFQIPALTCSEQDESWNVVLPSILPAKFEHELSVTLQSATIDDLFILEGPLGRSD